MINLGQGRKMDKLLQGIVHAIGGHPQQTKQLQPQSQHGGLIGLLNSLVQAHDQMQQSADVQAPNPMLHFRQQNIPQMNLPDYTAVPPHSPTVRTIPNAVRLPANRFKT